MYAIAILLSAVLTGVATPADDPYLAYARGVERGFAEGRPDALTVDFDALGRRITAGVEAPDKFRAGFLAGVKKSAVDRTLSKQLAEQVREGGSVTLLRVLQDKGGSRALYRVLTGSGVNYLELYLERGGPKAVRVVDCYAYLTGETWSQMMRRLYLVAAAEADMGILDRLAGKEQVFLQNAPALRAIQKAQAEKRWADVIAAYDKLPGALKKERVFLVPRFNAASSLGDEAQYRRAIEDWENALPGDPSLDLVSIDGHVLRKQYDRALQSVDRLDARVRDPYLEVLRASILLEKGDRPTAKQRLRAGIEADRKLELTYWTLIALAMQDQEWAATGELLTAVERDAGVRLADLEKVPEFAAYVKTREYKAWKQQRPKKGK